MLASKLSSFQVILGSQSPRRAALLALLEFPFTTEVKPVDEVYSDLLKAGEITQYLSVLKASKFLTDLQENVLVITSDTIVWKDNKPLEKPKDAQHAKEMLAELSGSKHDVYTSVCFTTSQWQETLTDKTTVYFNELTNEEIDYYIKSYKPFDKAGSYGIQEWLGNIAVERIEGCYHNVMGLPLSKVYQFLKSKFDV